MSLAENYIREGHPTIDDLIAEQRVEFPRDPQDLLGNFWPEEESIDDFLATFRRKIRFCLKPVRDDGGTRFVETRKRSLKRLLRRASDGWCLAFLSDPQVP